MGGTHHSLVWLVTVLMALFPDMTALQSQEELPGTPGPTPPVSSLRPGLQGLPHGGLVEAEKETT